MHACKQVQEYKDMVDLPATARFEKIRSIQDAYIKQGSNFEINIETKMRNEAMKVGYSAVRMKGQTALCSAQQRSPYKAATRIDSAFRR